LNCPPGTITETTECRRNTSDERYFKTTNVPSSDTSFCSSAWYDWYTIPNAYLGNTPRKALDNSCYEECDKGFVPYSSYDPSEDKQYVGVSDTKICVSKSDWLAGKHRNAPDFCVHGWIMRLGLSKEDNIQKIKKIAEAQFEKEDDSIGRRVIETSSDDFESKYEKYPTELPTSEELAKLRGHTCTKIDHIVASRKLAKSIEDPSSNVYRNISMDQRKGILMKAIAHLAFNSKEPEIKYSNEFTKVFGSNNGVLGFLSGSPSAVEGSLSNVATRTRKATPRIYSLIWDTDPLKLLLKLTYILIVLLISGFIFVLVYRNEFLRGFFAGLIAWIAGKFRNFNRKNK
jgi:hypothetical protein